MFQAVHDKFKRLTVILQFKKNRSWPCITESNEI